MRRHRRTKINQAIPLIIASNSQRKCEKLFVESRSCKETLTFAFSVKSINFRHANQRKAYSQMPRDENILLEADLDAGDLISQGQRSCGKFPIQSVDDYGRGMVDTQDVVGDDEGSDSETDSSCAKGWLFMN
jgi:hypothetical protein